MLKRCCKRELLLLVAGMEFLEAVVLLWRWVLKLVVGLMVFLQF